MVRTLDQLRASVGGAGLGEGRLSEVAVRADSACSPAWTYHLQRLAGLAAKVAMLALAGMFFIAGPNPAEAQSNNIMAQGYYYRAKELHEAGRNSDALPYVQRSEQSLGGTNRQLQYLHIMVLVGTRDYVGANRELQRFFAIVDAPSSAVRFANGVDELTDDEQRQLTRIMIEVMESSERQTASARKATIEADMAASLDAILAIAREFRMLPQNVYGIQYNEHRYSASQGGTRFNLGHVELLPSGTPNVSRSVTANILDIKRISAESGPHRYSGGANDFSVPMYTLRIEFSREVPAERVYPRESPVSYTTPDFYFFQTASAYPAGLDNLRSKVDRFNALLADYQAIP